MNQERQSWIECLKGWGIFFIVMGHVAGGGGHIAQGEVQLFLQFLYKYFYSFHVPLFFFLAGLTFSIGAGGFKLFFVKKVKRLLVPYFVFGVLSGIIYVLMSSRFSATVMEHATTAYYTNKTIQAWWVPFVGLIHGGGWPEGKGFISNSVLWFIPCLFVLEMMGFACERFLSSATQRAGVILLAFIIAYVFRKSGVTNLPWGIQLVPYYLPFFLVGRSLGVRTWFNIKDHRTVWVVASLFGILSLGCFAYMSPDLYASYWSLLWYVLFTLLSFYGILVWAFFAQGFKPKIIMMLGSASMSIMLLHKFPMLFLQLKVPSIRSFFANSVLMGILGTIGVSAACVVLCLVANAFILKWAPWMLGAKRPISESLIRNRQKVNNSFCF